MSPRPDETHYSYAAYADPGMARSFEEKRFGGPIGECVAATQARVLANMVGRIRERAILDVGTGTGRAALLLARGGAAVTAVDASEQMLAVARQRAAAEHAAIRFERGDAHALQFADKQFDVVVCLRVLMHAPDWRRCLAELCRVAERLVIFDYPAAASVAALESASRRAVNAVGARTEAYRVLSDAPFERRSIGADIASDRCTASSCCRSRFTSRSDRAGLRCGVKVSSTESGCSSGLARQ